MRIVQSASKSVQVLQQSAYRRRNRNLRVNACKIGDHMENKDMDSKCGTTYGCEEFHEGYACYSTLE